MLRDHILFESGNDDGSWISMDARDLADGHFRFFYAVAQTPIKALRIKHFRKAGRKNEYKEETGRQELAETGGRIPRQGYHCPKSRQPIPEELCRDPESKLHAQGQKGA